MENIRPLTTDENLINNFISTHPGTTGHEIAQNVPVEMSTIEVLFALKRLVNDGLLTYQFSDGAYRFYSGDR